MSEMSMNDPQFIRALTQIIREIVKQEIKNAKFNQMIPAKVISVGSGVADVQLNGLPPTIQGVKNLSNQTLNIGDFIYIQKINNSSNNMYIAIKP